MFYNVMCVHSSTSLMMKKYGAEEGASSFFNLFIIAQRIM